MCKNETFLIDENTITLPSGELAYLVTADQADRLSQKMGHSCRPYKGHRFQLDNYGAILHHPNGNFYFIFRQDLNR